MIDTNDEGKVKRFASEDAFLAVWDRDNPRPRRGDIGNWAMRRILAPRDGHRLTVDRIVPRMRHGVYEAANVTAACWHCNCNKSDRDFIGPVRNLLAMEARRG